MMSPLRTSSASDILSSKFSNSWLNENFEPICKSLTIIAFIMKNRLDVLAAGLSEKSEPCLITLPFVPSRQGRGNELPALGPLPSRERKRVAGPWSPPVKGEKTSCRPLVPSRQGRGNELLAPGPLPSAPEADLRIGRGTEFWDSLQTLCLKKRELEETLPQRFDKLPSVCPRLELRPKVA
jgi:hypothetical protein